MTFDPWGFEPKKKKSVPKKLIRRMVWDRDNGICQICHRRADRFDWELGHNRARVKGGQLTYKNTFVAHPSCNRSQHTLTLKETRRIIGGPKSAEEKAKEALRGLPMTQLTYLAKEHNIRLKGKTVEGFFSNEYKPPSKLQYVNALAKVLTPNKMKAELRNRKKTKVKRKRKKRSDSIWDMTL